MSLIPGIKIPGLASTTTLLATMETTPLLGLIAVLLITSVHHILATNYGNYINFGYQDINSPQIEVKVERTWNSYGNCQYKVVGRGVLDAFVQPCPPNMRDFDQINIKNYYAYFYKNYDPLGFYTDRKGTLVMIKPGGCLLRSYQPTTESTLSAAVCDKIKKKLDDEMVKLKDYWAKWEINFERQMENLPPVYNIVDPLENQPPTASLYYGQSGVTSASPVPTPGLPPQPVSPSLPPQPITSSDGAGKPTILGLQSIETEDENSVSNPMFTSFSNVFNNGGDDCTLERCVKGNGVHDCFKMPCPKVSATSVSVNGLVLWGHPDVNPFSFLSDERATLYLFEKGYCTKKTYTTKNGVTTSRAELLSPGDCVKAKNRLKRQGFTVGPSGRVSIGDPVPGDSTDDVVSPPSPAGLLSQPLSTDTKPATALTPGLPPQPVSPSLPPQPITSSADTGKPTILGLQSIETEDENSVGNPMFTGLSNVFNNGGDDCTLERCVKGNGVHDCFKMPCPKVSPTSLSVNGLVLWGHPDVNPFSFFSDERATLYLFEKGYCTKKTYTTKKGVTSSRAELLSPGDCVKAKNRLKRQGFTVGPSGRVSIGDPVPGVSTDDVVSLPSPAGLLSQPLSTTTKPATGIQDVNSKRIKASTSFPKTSNGECKVEISVVGKGVQDEFKEPCSDKPAKSVSTGNVFLLGDPRKDSISLYSTEPTVLYVIKNKICTKKTYTTRNGETKGVRTPLRLGRCNELKRSIFDLLAKASSSTLPVELTPRTSESPGDTSESSNTASELQQFKPTYPFKLDTENKAIHLDYEMTGVMYVDSFNVRGCYYYVTAKGKGINDHFQVSCTNEGKDSISTGDFMLFATPTSLLGLYSDTPSTLFILTKGTCYKKTYGVTPSGPTLMGGAECEEVKKRMAARLDSNRHLLVGTDNQVPVARETRTRVTITDDGSSDSDSSPMLQHPLLRPDPPAFDHGTSSQLTQNGPSTSSTTLGVSWRDGDFWRIYNHRFYVNFETTGMGQCRVEVVGRGVNDLIQDSCSVLGDVRRYERAFILAVVDPTKHSALYTDEWGVLVFVREERCFKKEYETEIYKKTKIVTKAMSSLQCNQVKNGISATIGVNFGA